MTISIRLKGLGICNRSQLLISQRDGAFRLTGIIGRLQMAERVAAPPLGEYRGPRGPSTVRMVQTPCWSCFRNARRASEPFLLVDPRTTLSPNHLMKSETYSPSRDALIMIARKRRNRLGTQSPKKRIRLCQMVITKDSFPNVLRISLGSWIRTR